MPRRHERLSSPSPGLCPRHRLPGRLVGRGWPACVKDQINGEEASWKGQWRLRLLPSLGVDVFCGYREARRHSMQPTPEAEGEGAREPVLCRAALTPRVRLRKASPSAAWLHKAGPRLPSTGKPEVCLGCRVALRHGVACLNERGGLPCLGRGRLWFRVESRVRGGS